MKLNKEFITKVSKLKNEPKWMTDFRVKAYKKFIELKNPLFGPEIKLDFSIINYYKKMDDKTETRHSELPLSLAQKQGLFLLLIGEKENEDGWLDVL